MKRREERRAAADTERSKEARRPPVTQVPPPRGKQWESESEESDTEMASKKNSGAVRSLLSIVKTDKKADKRRDRERSPPQERERSKVSRLIVETKSGARKSDDARNVIAELKKKRKAPVSSSDSSSDSSSSDEGSKDSDSSSQDEAPVKSNSKRVRDRIRQPSPNVQIIIREGKVV